LRIFAVRVRLSGDMTTWIFQGNPKIFDVDTYLAQQTDVLWGANQGFTMMKVGDRVYFWRSLGEGNAHSGIVASGAITEEPRERPDDAVSLSIWKVTPTDSLARRVAIRLDVPAKERLLPAVFLGQDPILRDLEILRVPNATNFRVKDDQVAPLAQAWDRAATTPLNTLLVESLKDKVREWRADAEAREQARSWTEQIRLVRPLAASLFADFLNSQAKLSELKEAFDRKTRLAEWEPLGLGGPSGAMVLNKWSKNFPEEEMTAQLLALFPVPKDIVEAEQKLVRFPAFCKQESTQESSSHRSPVAPD
jgi:EVE domain